MHMKTLLLAGLLASPLALASPPEGEPMDRFIEHVNNRADLDLTDTQKAQIRTIGEEQRAKHEQVRAETRSRVDAVLTPEQKAKLDKHRDEMKEKHADRLEKRSDRLEKRAEKVREHRSGGY